MISDQIQIKFAIWFQIKFKSNSLFDFRSNSNQSRHLISDQVQNRSFLITVWSRHVVNSGTTTGSSRSKEPRIISHLSNSCDDQWVVLLYTNPENTDRSRVKNPLQVTVRAFDSNRTNQIRLKSSWVKSNQVVSNQIKLIQIKSNWFKSNQLDSNQIELIPIKWSDQVDSSTQVTSGILLVTGESLLALPTKEVCIVLQTS